jgi:uncharacterized protein (TIGR00369 family)
MSDPRAAGRAAVADHSLPPAPTGLRMGGRPIEVEAHNCFACGTLNAHGLRLELHSQDGRCWSEVALPKRFEGWDGIAHGGIVATILDEVMAWALIDRGALGVTARIAVDFKRPVRVGHRIRGEGWVVDARRRLLRTGGRIFDPSSGDVLATAEGTYVAVPDERRRELMERYRFRFVADSPGMVDRSGHDGGPPTEPPSSTKRP